MSRALLTTVAALVALLLGAACSSNRTTKNALESTFNPSAAAPPPRFAASTLVRERGVATWPVAVDSHHLVWETGPLEEENIVTELVQRNLSDRRRVVLAHGITREFGLASTSGWVIYVAQDGTTLEAIRHDGSRRFALTHDLAAPIASLGELVAWAEQADGRQRIVVRDMANATEWVAADMAQCDRGLCYRIDAVVLSARGVVFDRGAVGSQPSYVVRRAFSDRHPTTFKIPNDPQPDLVPSATGAVFYAFNRGWYRWDWGQRTPRRLPFSATPPAPLLGFSGREWYLLTQKACEFGVVARSLDGHTNVVESPSQLRSLERGNERTCIQLQTFSWTGRQPLMAWAIVPKEAEEAHIDFGLVGAITAG